MKSISIHMDFFKAIRKHSDEEIGRFFRALAADIDGSDSPCLPPTLELLKELIDDQNQREQRRALKRDTKDYKDWRIAVYKRDGFNCQHCGEHGGNLHAHHIERYKSNPLLRTELSNGITLCADCHRALHKREGY